MDLEYLVNQMKQREMWAMLWITKAQIEKDPKHLKVAENHIRLHAEMAENLCKYRQEGEK